MTAHDDLVMACRILGGTGHTDSVFGHVSARREGGGCVIKGAGIGLEEVTPKDLIEVDGDATVVHGSRRCHAEVWIHLGVLAARPDVNAVVHTHPFHGVCLGATDGPLRPIGHEGAYFQEHGVPCYTRTSGLIASPELGHEVAATLGSADALFLRNHGIVAAGRTVREATIAALLLEKACAVQMALAGIDHHWSTPEDAAGKRKSIYNDRSIEEMWQYECRAALRRRHGPPHQQETYPT